MRFPILIALVLLAANASAQNLSVFNLDASNFPTIKAKFYAFDANGQQQSPSASEITVTENGTSRAVTSITCPIAEAPKQLSSVLVMDVSGSMSSGSGTSPNIDIAKAAATYWISNVPLGESECTITSFDDANYFNQDYTTNRTKLANAIAGLHPQNGTNYNAALLLPMSSGLEVTKLGKHQKVIVFLSDGLPNFEPQTSAIIAEAQKQNCLIFAVTVGLPCPQCLKDISNQTGAKWFENITSQAQIEEVYQEILQQAQGGSPCEITWQSGVSCTSDPRNVEFDWNNNGTNKSYMTYDVPSSAVAGLQIVPQSLYIRSKHVGIKFDTTVTITANNSAFTITNITSTNPSYDINPKSFTLASGKSQTLTVSYTPPDSSYTWTRFDIATDLCAQTYYASASYPGHKPTIPTLKLTRPNGGEFLVVGADTVITWKGIPLTDTVKLEYSTDAGSSWNFITDKATGGRYAWHIPKTVSDRCLVRVEQHTKSDNYNWVRSMSGRNYENGRSLSVDIFGNIYIIGYFSDTISFGKIKLTSLQRGDMFLAKYLPDGSVEWAKRICSSTNSNISASKGIATDSYGNIYLTGNFSGSNDFGGITLVSQNLSDIFIAKYLPDGKLEWAKSAGNKTKGSTFEIASDSIGNIYITGFFSDTAYFDNIKIQSHTSVFADMFIAKYHPDGQIEWVKNIGGIDAYLTEDPPSIAVDKYGNSYLTGSFSGSPDFGGISLNNISSAINFFVAKYKSDGVLEWVNRSIGNGYDAGHAVTVDFLGNVYATGSFNDTSDFGGISLQSKGTYNVFIVKYNSFGVIEWAKKAGSNNDVGTGACVDQNGNLLISGDFDEDSIYFDSIVLRGGKNNGHTNCTFIVNCSSNGKTIWAKSATGSITSPSAISIDANNSIFVVGSFDSTSHFGIDSLVSIGDFDAFLWKISDNLLQSDTSDALFSIGVPQVLSEDIDMGKVLVNSAKDSVIQKFIRNGGSYPFHVDSIDIAGADASQFSLVSGIPPFTIASAGAHQVEFDFRPTSAGIKYGQIKIFTQADTLIQNITGTGIAPELYVIGNTIDFGLVEVLSHFDTTITAAIVNNGNTAINFTSSSQLGPDMKQFSLQTGDAPFTLSPGSSHSVTLRFAPKLIGRTSGRIAFLYNGANSPAILNVFGQATGGLIMIPNDSGYGGDHKNMPMVLENERLASVQSVATNYRARIAYDKTVLSASGGSIQSGNTFDTLTISNQIGTSDTLAYIPFVAIGSKGSVTPMRIVDFTWLNGAGLPADHDAETESGIFHLLNGTKYPEPNWAADIVEIFPNPAKETFHFEVTTAEAGRTQITLINILGQKVATIFDGELKRGAHEFDFNTHDLRTGSYYLSLTTPSLSTMKKVDVIR